VTRPTPETRRPARALACLGALLMLAACSAASKSAGDGNAAGANAAAEAARGVTIPLTIRTAKGTHRFDVELALTPGQQEQGLMFRKDLPADGGMIFPMKPPRVASFWMKNTVIPLDMLFIRTDGSVAMIAHDTKPYAREPVSAGVPVSGVLELAGGRAAALGIAEGDIVNWGNCAAPGERPDEAWDQVNFCPPRPASAATATGAIPQ
jgi:uncharacterized membrane protein (UPF0127 family)